MPWTFLDVRLLLSNLQLSTVNLMWDILYQQSTPASLSYTLLGGFVVVVSALLFSRCPHIS